MYRSTLYTAGSVHLGRSNAGLGNLVRCRLAAVVEQGLKRLFGVAYALGAPKLLQLGVDTTSQPVSLTCFARHLGVGSVMWDASLLTGYWFRASEPKPQGERFLWSLSLLKWRCGGYLESKHAACPVRHVLGW